MTRDIDDEIEQAAVDWHARVLAGDADWDAFADWLDAAPGHQPAYDRIALLDADVTEHVREHGMPVFQETPEPMVVSPGRAPRRWWVGGAVAASLTAAIVSLPYMSGHRSETTVLYATTTGQKSVPLPGGGSALLDANSQIALASDGKVRMDRGAAYFDVGHGGEHPLEIRTGDFVVRDVGTRFAVSRDKQGLAVAVEQGLVDVNWRSGAVTRLAAGQSLRGNERTGASSVSSVDTGDVASWRDGRLVYNDTPLSLVAADLSRYCGAQVVVDPSIANLKLSGILLIRNGSDLVDQISAILPVDARRDDGTIRLVGRHRR